MKPVIWIGGSQFPPSSPHPHHHTHTPYSDQKFRSQTQITPSRSPHPYPTLRSEIQITFPDHKPVQDKVKKQCVSPKLTMSVSDKYEPTSGNALARLTAVGEGPVCPFETQTKGGLRPPFDPPPKPPPWHCMTIFIHNPNGTNRCLHPSC